MSGDSAVTVGVEMWLSGYPGEGYLFRPPVRRYACQWKNGCFIIKCLILGVRGAFRDRWEGCAPVCELAPGARIKLWPRGGCPGPPKFCPGRGESCEPLGSET